MAKFQNSQLTCPAAGLALLEGEAFYISAAGPAGAVKSLWASLVGNNSGIMAPDWYSRSQTFSFGGKKGTKTIWNNIPKTTYKHFVTVMPDPTVILLVDPTAAGRDSADTIDLRLQRMEEAYNHFRLWLQGNVDMPVKPHWVPVIWQQAQQTDYKSIHQMITAGDCVGAWKINPKFTWADYIQMLVTEKQVPFEETPCD